jgi:hypothetical protein
MARLPKGEGAFARGEPDHSPATGRQARLSLVNAVTGAVRSSLGPYGPHWSPNSSRKASAKTSPRGVPAAAFSLMVGV